MKKAKNKTLGCIEIPGKNTSPRHPGSFLAGISSVYSPSGTYYLHGIWFNDSEVNLLVVQILVNIICRFNKAGNTPAIKTFTFKFVGEYTAFFRLC